MFEQQHHEMVLAVVHESGAEEWFCPTCGRRFLMQWPPEYKKVILEPGDEFAIHSGGKGGPQAIPPASQPQTRPADPAPVDMTFAEYCRLLEPFDLWVDAHEDLWSKPL